MIPSEFLALSEKDKAFVIAAIRIKQENEKNEERKLKSKGRRK